MAAGPVSTRKLSITRRPGLRMRREYLLREGKKTLGSLRWERVLSSLATASAKGGEWTFKRVGFFSTRFTVRKSPHDDDVAVFRPAWFSCGVLEFRDGRQLFFRGNFWGSR